MSERGEFVAAEGARVRRRTEPPRAWLAALCLALVATCLAPVAIAKVAVEGDTAPDFLGRDTGGHAVKVSAYRGKVVLVSFWATWCPPCRQELPVLGNIQRAGKGEIQVVAVNIESLDVFRAAAKLLVDLKVVLAHDEGQASFEHYGGKALPRLVLIGRDGRIAKFWTGYGEGEIPELADDLTRALAAGREPSEAATSPQ